MGHMHIKNLSKLTIKHIYAKGKVNIIDLIDYAIKKGEKVQCSEGEYDSMEMYRMAFEYVLMFHYDSTAFMCKDAYVIGIKTIEPVIETQEHKDIMKKWWKDHNVEREEVEKIMWRFAEGGRKRYLDGKVQHMTSITN